MSTNEIKILLDSFYDGNTSKEEEKQLIAYFQSDNVDEVLMSEKDAFLAMLKTPEADVPLLLESKLNELIDQLNETEAVNNDKLIEPVLLLPEPKRKYLMWRYVSVAACIIVIVLGGLYVNKTVIDKKLNQNIALQSLLDANKSADEISPEDKEKLKQAESAMLLMSEKLNKGMNQLAMASSHVDKTNRILNKTLKRNKIKES